LSALEDLARQAQRPTLIAPTAAAQQPPRIDLEPLVLHAAIGSLAIGGAERIVLDWAAAASRSYRVRIVVLRTAPVEWPLPEGVEFVRMAAEDASTALEHEGRRIARSGNPRVLCHLLTRAERLAMQRGGAVPVPVLHNAREGWLEPAAALGDIPPIAVSRAAAAELYALGRRQATVIRHVPTRREFQVGARRHWRARWEIPEDAFVIGMIGGIKPQKAYPRAVRALSALLERRDAWLVILGGPTGRDGAAAWHAVIDQCQRLDLCERVRLPGFVSDAAAALPAFDVPLNTSRYEGLSIATLEALAAGLPVVASRVGGQGELPAPGLHLLTDEAPIREWVDAIENALNCIALRPSWVGFPSARLWSLMHLPMSRTDPQRCLFVTANLNAGGAQRSLVNLALGLGKTHDFDILVCGNSSTAEFGEALRQGGIRVWRTADSSDAFDHAESILRYASQQGAGSIVFWNVDAKVKLLVCKRLAYAPLRVIDVSPGAYAFEEMDAIAGFQSCIAYDAHEYYGRLDRLVLKYDCTPPVAAWTSVIRNGVPLTRRALRLPRAPRRRIVVSGRIAPSKYLLEIVDAMQRVWLQHADAELHVLGTAEARQRDYADKVFSAAGAEIGRRIHLHGAAFDAPQRLPEFDLALVVGRHQGCPNTVLEALAAGLPVVANDSGGTRELVIDGRTGILLPDREPATIAAGLLRVMTDAKLGDSLARNGRSHVERRFSMRAMTAEYQRLLFR
jgi:glycosyltransferase involved in cell wall biosynthesis